MPALWNLDHPNAELGAELRDRLALVTSITDQPIEQRLRGNHISAHSFRRLHPWLPGPCTFLDEASQKSGNVAVHLDGRRQARKGRAKKKEDKYFLTKNEL